MLEHELLTSLLVYNSENGLFFWRVHGKGKQQNRPVGSTSTNGYRQITINYKMYLAHRLAWFYLYGSFPNGFIDHINGNKQDNRIENLRIVSHIGNCQNQRKATSRSKTGLIGVCSDVNNRYRARIRVNGKDFHLGVYSSPEEAHEIYKKAKRLFHKTCTI